MDRDLIHFLNTIFKDHSHFSSIGYSKLTASILHGLIKGETIFQLSEKYNRKPAEIQTILKLNLIHLPEKIRNKLSLLNYLELDEIHEKLDELNNCVEEYQKRYSAFKIYTIAELKMPKRIKNTLWRMGISNTDQLLQHSKEDLSNFKNFGARSIDVLQEALSVKGLSLK